VARGWRRLHNVQLHNLYASSNLIRVIKWRRMRGVGHITLMGELRNSLKISVGKPEGKRPRGRPRRRWEDSIGMKY
jgi:hypothetical protein